MSSPAPRNPSSKRRWPWIVGALVVVIAVPIAVLGVPILLHQNQGVSTQEQTDDPWPTDVTAEGDDGRTRVITVTTDAGAEVDTSALEPGQRLVVTGSGFDGSQGIYVAICVIPADATIKPGPCLGGVPEQTETQAEVGTIEFAPSNWINDDWAWRLFGARSYDDVAAGTFTAYLEVPDPVGENIDCTTDACGIFTRNDHTALTDRVQDVYLPVAFR